MGRNRHNQQPYRKKEVEKEVKFVLQQLTLAQAESKQKNLKTNTNTKNTTLNGVTGMQTSNIGVKTFSNARNIQHKINQGNNLIKKLNLAEYSEEFALGKKVNGVQAFAWKGMQVDLMYVKWIDYVEAGGDYYKKVSTKTRHKSTAFGRYQIIESTARSYCRKLGIPYEQWKDPVNQDKIFQALTNDNIKFIKNLKINVDILSLWVAHNLGTPQLAYMFGVTDKPHPKLVKAIQNNTSYRGTDPVEAKSVYFNKYIPLIRSVVGGVKGTERKNQQKTSSYISKSSGINSYNFNTQKFDMNYFNIKTAGNNLMSWASQFVGRAYSQKNRGLQGGTVLATSNSYDCSSLAALFAKEYYGIPVSVFGTYTEDQYSYLQKNAVLITNISQAQPGDFVLYNYKKSEGRRVSHIAIVVDKGKMLHARGTKQGVQITAIFKKNLVGIYRLKPDAEGIGNIPQENRTQNVFSKQWNIPETQTLSTPQNNNKPKQTDKMVGLNKKQILQVQEIAKNVTIGLVRNSHNDKLISLFNF